MSENEMDKKAIFTTDFYVIGSDYRLIDFNESVAKNYEGIKVGDYCYAATMKRDTPCLHCPIAGNSDCDSPVYYDPFYEAWIEAIFSELGDGKYAVTCRPASDRGLRVFDELGNDDNEELIAQVSGHAANDKLKEIEHELKLNQIMEKLRRETMAEAIRGGFVSCKNDDELTITYMSEQFAKMLGYTVDELMEVTGGKYTSLVDAEEFQKEYNRVMDTYQSGIMFEAHYRLRCKDGSWKYVEDKGRLLSVEGYRDESWSYIIDKDEAIRIENALKNEENHVKEVQRLVDELEENQIILEEKQEKLEELTAEQEAQIEEIRSLNDELTSLNEEMTAINEELLSVNDELSESKQQTEGAYKLIEGLSSEFHTLWTIDKETLEMKMIRSSESSTIPGAVQIADDKKNYDKVYLAYIEKYVEPQEKTRVKKALNPKVVFRQLERKDLYSVNYLRKNDKGIVAYQQAAFSNAGKDNDLIVLGFRDVDKIVKQEQDIKRELAEAKEDAERANAAKTNFLFNMSHDIRTPMNAILGFTGFIAKEVNNPEKVLEYVGKIENSGEYLLSIINNILDMARIDSGNAKIDENFMDILGGDKSAFTMFFADIKKKHLEFHTNQNITHRYIWVDDAKIQQITVNLISNAIKYTPEGGSVTVDIKEVPCNREGYATYVQTVTDTGIGMSEEFQKHIFEAFSRERNTTDSKVIGTGLGMAIVKKLVDLLGGTIEVKSEIGKGTTFTLTMTHKIVQNPEEYIEKLKKKKASEVDLHGKRILLAEDNELNAEIAKIILKSAGAQVDWVENGVECMDKLFKAENGYYDMILMDIQMPILNGYSATRKIREWNIPGKSDIPIVAMTANAFEEDKKAALEAGMNGHVAKPVNIPQLMETLSDIFK